MIQSARLSLRVDFPGGARLGPGKAALLETIDKAGSIRGAAMELGMSYPRALKLIDQLNRDFRGPLVTSHHGGAGHGGSQLSELGRSVLARYRAICSAAEDAVRGELDGLAEAQSQEMTGGDVNDD